MSPAFPWPSDMGIQYPSAPFTGNAEINRVFAKNILSYFNLLQKILAP